MFRIAKTRETAPYVKLVLDDGHEFMLTIAEAANVGRILAHLADVRAGGEVTYQDGQTTALYSTLTWDPAKMPATMAVPADAYVLHCPGVDPGVSL